MANVNFYALGDDRLNVLRAVFQDPALRVFESYSVPDHELREFSSADEAWDWVCAHPADTASIGLSALPTDATSTGFVIERFAMKGGAASYRSQTRGWGLIHLQLTGTKNGRLWKSSANHNSEKRALAFCDV